MSNINPLFKQFPHMLHGGDYNPEQWKRTPEIWDEDMRLMQLVNCNCFSGGIFSWAELEPEEGVFNFEVLDTIIDKIYKNGGIFIGTYTTGTVNETDLCYLGGRPAGKLKNVFGLWAEELDVLYPEDKNEIDLSGKRYPLVTYFDVAHPSTAEALATVTDDYYAGNGAIFKNGYGKGSAYYIAFRSVQDFYNDFYASLADEFALIRALPALPEGVSAHTREGGYLFIENYNGAAAEVALDGAYINMETGETVTDTCRLDAYGIAVLQKN